MTHPEDNMEREALNLVASTLDEIHAKYSTHIEDFNKVWRFAKNVLFA